MKGRVGSPQGNPMKSKLGTLLLDPFYLCLCLLSVACLNV